MNWLVVYENSNQEIVKAEDLYELHNQVDSEWVVAVIKLNVYCKETEQ